MTSNPTPSHQTIRPPFFRTQDITPWDSPIDASLLLHDLARLIARHVILPKWGAETLALWTLHTYTFHLRHVSTYIGLESPEKRCGKTTLLGVLSQLVNRPVVAANISSSAFFRVIEELQPTLLIDEADTFLRGNEEIRGILNSGYTRQTAFVVRVRRSLSSDDSGQPSNLATFSSWCPKIIAAIGHLPETLADRCILIRMHRKTPTESCERLTRLDTTDLRRQCARFALDFTEAIPTARCEIPTPLNDRAGDIWEPLFVLADLAGEDWPRIAREAAVALSASAEKHNPIGALLLDIFCHFILTKNKRVFSRTLVEHLKDQSDRPWSEARAGKGITELWLAQQLRPYGISPKTLWIGPDAAKGYLKDDFDLLFRRYITKADVEELKLRTSPPPADNPSNPPPPAGC
jgi:putative DNA primase/helicase